MTIKSSEKAGKGFNPQKYPSTAKLCKFNTAIATKYNRAIQKIINITISFFSALNFNFMHFTSIQTYYTL